MIRGASAEIHLPALLHNLKIVKSFSQNSHVIAVVKADAYGHGLVEISKELAQHGVSSFAVAYTEEAKVLREGGIKGEILVLFDRTDFPDYFDYDLVPVIQDKKAAEAFSKEAVRRRRKIAVHLKIDTGMGRIGFLPGKALSDALEISSLKGIDITGLLSHFSEADLSDMSYAVQQLELFNRTKDSISEKTGLLFRSHIANSAAILRFKDALLDAVRPGLMLYGYSPFPEDYNLMPAMKVKTKILALRSLPQGFPVSYGRTFVTRRKSIIAVIPVGYADGYNRLLSNNADVLVKDRRVPVVGRVCMDLAMIDVTDVERISENDEVILLGRQGNETITAYELAARMNTIPYEILTSFGSRSVKEYMS